MSGPTDSVEIVTETSVETTGELLLIDPAKEVALDAAARLYAGGRFQQAACVMGDDGAADAVLATADKFTAWLRRVGKIRLTLVSIEEQESGESLPLPPGGSMTTIDTSQQVRYIINSADDRGFPVDATLAVSVEPAGAVTAEILEASSGTASGKDELLVKAVAPGSALVKVFDPAQPDVVFGSDAVDVTPGGVATVVLSAPVIEEQDAPAPDPEL